MLSEIKNKHATLINQGVKNAFGTDSWELVEILNQGLSPSTVYKLSIDGKHYIAKLSDPNHPHNNLIREYHATRTAAKNQIAPAVHYAAPDAGIIIMSCIEPATDNTINWQQPNIIKKFAYFVKSLHACDNFQKDDSVFERIDIISSQLPLESKEANLVKQAIAIKNTVQTHLVDTGDLRPCHNDLNPYNLLFDGSNFRLVDWAVAAQESFYFDLASCATHFYFQNNVAIEILLNAYFERPPNQHEQDKFYLMKLFVYVYYGIMFIFISAAQKANLLPQSEIDSLPDYAQFMNSIGKGEISLGDAITQQQLGFIYLKMAASEYNSETFTHIRI